MKITTWSVMAGAALALVGCADEDFDTPWLLNHVRILAMQAEPPQPATGQSTTVRALVYQPPASADPSKLEKIVGYQWSWCPFATLPDNPEECPIKQPMADALFAGIPGVPPLDDLGTGETATFTNPFPASLLASLCQGDYSGLPVLKQALAEKGDLSQTGGALFRCGIAGYPITIKLVVTSLVGEKAKPLPAIFKVYLPVNDAVPPNHNPEVGAISIVENGVHYALDEAATWSGVRDREVPLLLDVPLSSAESLPNWQDVYLKKDPHHQAREQLNVSWFTEGGDFGSSDHKGGNTTVYFGSDPNDPVSPFSSLAENTLNPPKADKYERATARVYAVVYDIRSGVSWTTGVIRMVDTPESRDGGVADAPPDAPSPLDAADSEADAEVTDSGAEVLP